MKLIKGGLILDSENVGFFEADVLINEGKIIEVEENIKADCEVIEAKDKYVIPAFIDIHTHGCKGFDFLDTPAEGMEEVFNFYETHGVKTLYPTIVTASETMLLNAIINVRKAAKMYKNINIPGVHIEGPFISLKQPGCHKVSEIRNPTLEELDKICEAANGLKIKITIAPEIAGAEVFIKEAVRRGINIGIGHSDADSETVKKAISWGADTMVHLYNAMSPLHHRKPGCVGMGLLSDVYTELIVDGYHINPDIVKLTYKIKGTDKLVLITDSMMATGMPDGKYSIGGIDVYMKNGKVTTIDGVLAGSTLNLNDAVKNLMKFADVSLEEAIVCATRNPAKAVGIYDKIGSIEKGKKSNILILDKSGTILDGCN